MNNIWSYSKISERLAVLLCDRSQRDGSKSICQTPAIKDIAPASNSGLEIIDGIEAWHHQRGRTTRHGPDNYSIVYPVGGARAVATDKFLSALLSAGMWRGEYGQERKDLLRFLIRWYREKGL